MRKTVDLQAKLGSVDILGIKFDLSSRDEIPKLLMGLQYIYRTPEIREEVFKVLEEIIPENTDKNNGRPGMDLWKILVLGTIRLNCNWDYDKLHEITNNHKTLRKMLGHGLIDDEYNYALQTLKDNVSLLTPEVLDKINQIAVKAGHKLVGGKKDEKLRGRCDSFVVETDVHYPTDINLLFDSVGKVINLVAAVCFSLKITTWRQSNHNIRKIKKLFRRVQNLKHSSSEGKDKKAKRDQLIRDAHQDYIGLVGPSLERANETIKHLRDKRMVKEDKLSEIEKYIIHAKRQIDQIRRRIINGEKIPHNEKLFSVFEEHTEWICKGKAGISQELGVRVCILDDQYGFILHHQVMQDQTDDQVAVAMVKETKDNFSELSSCSFDKAFYTQWNRDELSSLLDFVVISKKGKLSAKDVEIESSAEFVEYKRKHSAVESAINALENHSLDRCPDHGIDGFKRYISLSILARNIQIFGSMIQKKMIHMRKRAEGMIRRKEREKNVQCLRR